MAKPCIAIAAAVALATAADALSISQNNRLGYASSVVAVNGGGAARGRRPYMTTPWCTNLQGGSTVPRLSMSAAGDGDSDYGGNNVVPQRVRGVLGRMSRKIRGNNGASSSRREQFRRKLATLAVAFSALLAVGAGRRDGLPSTSTPNSASLHSMSSASSVVARGGGAATATRSAASKSGMLSSIVSRARHGPRASVDQTIVSRWDDVAVRGGGIKKKDKGAGAEVEEFAVQTRKTFRDALSDLNAYMKGPKADTLFLLCATALITPLCKMAGTSPILGFLASGMLLGPNGFGVISGIHTTETLAELGIVFFLFEMGIELSVERLKSMKRDVFGLGLSQYAITAAVLGIVAKVVGGLSAPAAVVVGGALSLSSSAFVLQLIKDKKDLSTRYGKASFGVLLLQDLAVVPLLVATPILAGNGSLASALGGAVVKAFMALSGIALAGRFALNPLFKTVAAANSQEAFLGVILFTALGMSFLTEGLGLSNTLGAFLAGVLLSETKYRYQVEADIAPFRGILLGLFFVTVGFEIDVRLIANNLPTVSAIVAGILGLKAGILTLLSRAFGLSASNAIRTGLILSQGGEFAFVAFGLAKSVGILDAATTKMLLTSVSLTMALTPFLDNMGGKIAKKMEEGADFTHYMGQDEEALEITSSNNKDDSFVVVVGYGIVGKVVCDLLDTKFIKYVGMENDPKKAIEARNRGLPVFFGDVGRPEVMEAFNIQKARAVIVTISDKAEATRAVIALRRMYPDKPIFARAKDADHAKRLQTTLDVAAMVPILPEDNLLLTLPFGGAVLRSLGAPAEEVTYILAEKRRELLSGKELEKFEEDTVLAQLGVEKPEEDDEEDATADDDEPSGTVAEVVVNAKKQDGSPVAEKLAKDVVDVLASEVKEVVISKESDELKPLVKQVIESNMSPQSNKSAEKDAEKDVEDDTEEESHVSELESELEAQGEEVMEPL